VASLRSQTYQLSLVTPSQTYAPYSNLAMIDGTGPRPIEERSGAKTFMLDDHNQSNLCTNASAPGWWFERKDELEVLSRERCPLYVYNDETLNDTFFDLLCIDAFGRLFYKVAANPHPRILEKAYQLGAGFECASSVELEHVLRAFTGIESQKLLFATTFAGPEEYDYAFKKGATVLISNLNPLRSWPDVFKDRGIFVCIESENLQQPQSDLQDSQFPLKSGVVSSEFDTLMKLLKDLSITVRGLHIQSKTPIFSPPDLNETVSFLAGLSGHFPKVSVFSFGKGIGISTKPGLEIPDFEATRISFETIKDMHPEFGLWLVPGGRIVSHAGVLLTEILETYQIEGNDYVRINAGMELLIRSALSGPHHEIVNFSKLGEKKTSLTHIIGIGGDPDNTICCIRRLAPVEKGDILLITNTGACGSEQGLASEAIEAEHQHYLRARKMCSVKI
jgi:bifunctional diaminopimelate decarboxylase / aspartate kinase